MSRKFGTIQFSVPLSAADHKMVECRRIDGYTEVVYTCNYTRLYSFRFSCRIVSFTAANTNLIFSVSVTYNTHALSSEKQALLVSLKLD